MSKRVLKNKKSPVSENVLKIENVNVPVEMAKIFRGFYEAFLAQGFTSEQAFKLTEQVFSFYLWAE